MEDLALAIQEFKDGQRTEDALLHWLDDTLATGTSDPASLLTELLKEHTEQPLKGPLFATLLSRINAHIQSTTGDPDDGTQFTEERRSARSETHTEAATEALTETSPRTAAVHQPQQATEPAESTSVAARAKQPNPMHHPTVGDVVNNRFELEELIGEGGMSRVYRALDRRKMEANSREPYLAVKVLDVSSRNQSTAFMALQREAQKSQALQHPNIVRVFDFDRDEDTVFMTMEHLSGEALSTVIQKHRSTGLPMPDVLAIVEQMGAALAHAHKQRIVHADFKPSNVFLTDANQIKVIDFGIARAYQAPEDTAADQTLFDPRALGALTPAYASPEMFENLEPDPKDDIYSLGCVTYELCTGQHPFAKRRAPDAKAGGEKAAKPSNLSVKQWQALQGALAFDRASRTATVSQFLNDFLPSNTTQPARSFGKTGLIAAVTLLTLGLGYWWWQQPQPQPIDEPAVLLTRSADCDLCPNVISLPAGSSMIGSPPTEADRRAAEGPSYDFALAAGFAIGEAEITVREFRRYAEAEQPALEGCRTLESQWQIVPALSWRNPGFEQTESHPVTCVSWQDVQGYLQWLNSQSEALYRLPTEAEWEYAARAGGLAARQWEHEDSACRYANVADSSAAARYPKWDTYPCTDGSVHTAPARRGVANAFQLFDMQGNLFEWTQDCWTENYANVAASAMPDTPPTQPANCAARVLRGGSYHTAPSEQRLAFRNRFDPEYRANTFGFRVMRATQ